MTLRVVQWGTGNIGRQALRLIVQHPELELAGVKVYSQEKCGRDAALLCGLDAPVGVTASIDVEELVENRVDCVCYMAGDPALSDPRVPGSRGEVLFNEICWLLRSGVNVVSTALIGLMWPMYFGQKIAERLDEACREGGSSFRCTGFYPGITTDVAPLAFSGCAEKITHIKLEKVSNWSSYTASLGERGFMLTPDEFAERAKQFQTSGNHGFGMQARLIARIHADVLRFTIDDITESVEGWPCDEDIEIAAGTVSAGTIAALRYRLQAIVDGVPRLTLERIARLHDAVAPHWLNLPGGNGDRITIEGIPSIMYDSYLAGGGAASMKHICIATAAQAVNAIPAICPSDPGVYTFMNAPLTVGRGLIATG